MGDVDTASVPSCRSWAFTLAVLLAGPACAPSEGEAEPTVARARLDGHVRAYMVDYAEGDSRTGYALERAPGDYVELEPSAELAAHVDDRVTLSGHDVSPRPAPGARDRVRVGERRLRVTSLVVHERADDGRVARSGGAPVTVRAAVVLLNFAGVTPQSFSKSDAQARMTTVRAYYQELSYGNWNIEADVFGPFQVAKPVDCNLDRIGDLAREAAGASGVDIGAYAHVGVTLPDNGDSGLDCACGLAWLGRTPAQPDPGVQSTSLYTCTDPNAFAHEMGHGFGLHHAATARCDGQMMRRDVHDACTVEEYGNQFNTMGNGLGHMSAFQKATMRWLDGCNDVRVTSDGIFDLVPIQIASDGVQSLRIATGDARDGNPLYYYVEYRNPSLATFNAGGSPPREKGPGLHLDVAPAITIADGDRRPLLLDVSSGTPGSFVDPRLTAGRSFADPDGRVTVTLLEAAAEKARVQVTFPGGGSGVNLCGDGAIAPGSDGAGAGVTLFEDCDFGGWAVALAPGDHAVADLIAAGALDNDASSLHVLPGYQAVLFDGPDFTGASRTLTGASACLVDEEFNDTLSSLRIQAIAGPDAGARDPADAAVPAGGADAGGAGLDDPEGGCGCAVAAREDRPRAAWLGLALGALGALIAGRRGRRRRAQTKKSGIKAADGSTA